MLSISKAVVVGLILSNTCAACQSLQRKTSALEALPTGIWTTPGYGYVFQVAEDRTIAGFDETAISCVPPRFALAAPSKTSKSMATLRI